MRRSGFRHIISLPPQGVYTKFKAPGRWPPPRTTRQVRVPSLDRPRSRRGSPEPRAHSREVMKEQLAFELDVAPDTAPSTSPAHRARKRRWLMLPYGWVDRA